MANIYTSADQLIGKTPLLELKRIEEKEGLEARVLAKKEYRREDFEEALAGTSYKVAGFCEKNKISTADSTEIGI